MSRICVCIQRHLESDIFDPIRPGVDPQTVVILNIMYTNTGTDSDAAYDLACDYLAL